MPESMSKSQIQRFTRFVEDQGARVTRTKKGLLIRFPDGTSTVQHFTNSDTRAELNQIARFRRAGMVHPNDTRQKSDSLPAYITSGSISEKTRQRIIDYVVSQGYPETVLSSAVVKDLKMDPGWANRALFHTGFRPGPAKNRKIGRPWYTPEEILCLRETNVVEEKDATPEEEAAIQEVINDPISEYAEVERPQEVAPEPEHKPQVPEVVEAPQEHVEDLQFIDMRDSWVVGVQELLGEHLARMVEDRLSVLRVVGLDYEIRVWRK